MVKGTEKMGSFSIPEKDKRVTRIGRLLRKTHFDELPNLWNVLKGDMALFGPRPEVSYYVNKMPPAVRRVVLSVKPGCLDRATMWNFNEGQRLNGKEDPEAYYEEVIWPEKLRLQCESILKVNL
uniref:Putative sugar transferase n=1 Tax=viral metagenome TaxID=1070528 RepID=A0A6M3KAG0_9ZZZZ